MDRIKDDSYYIGKILQDASFMISHTKGLTYNELEENEILLDSVMFRMVQISENASRLTDSFKRNHSSIDWHAINGMRNRIVHDYGKVDLTVIFETVIYDIPALYEYLDKLGVCRNGDIV